MTVKEIVEKYLKDNKYDGLYYPGECACSIEDGLMPCDGDSSECKSGIFGKCSDCKEKDNNCDMQTDAIDNKECPHGWNWCIGPKSEEINETQK